MDKISKHVEFPERLDLSPYMSQNTRKTAKPYQLYGVLVHMGGGCHSGHYYAYVKNANGKWYCMDDDDVSIDVDKGNQAERGEVKRLWVSTMTCSRFQTDVSSINPLKVRPVSIQTVMRERAYMLFYTQEPGTNTNAEIKVSRKRGDL
jgi:ubiquitin C-terminal hydrolase